MNRAPGEGAKTSPSPPSTGGPSAVPPPAHPPANGMGEPQNPKSRGGLKAGRVWGRTWDTWIGPLPLAMTGCGGEEPGAGEDGAVVTVRSTHSGSNALSTGSHGTFCHQCLTPGQGRTLAGGCGGARARHVPQRRLVIASPKKRLPHTQPCGCGCQSWFIYPALETPWHWGRMFNLLLSGCARLCHAGDTIPVGSPRQAPLHTTSLCLSFTSLSYPTDRLKPGQG